MNGTEWNTSAPGLLVCLCC